jgi:hypothetical protein
MGGQLRRSPTYGFVASVVEYSSVKLTQQAAYRQHLDSRRASGPTSLPAEELVAVHESICLRAET